MKHSLLILSVLFCLILPATIAYEYGNVQVGSSWVTVNFDNSFSSTPLVFTQANSNNGNLVLVRLRNINANSFQMKILGAKIPETVAWLAVQEQEVGQTMRTYKYQNKYTTWYSLAFQTPFTSIPYVLAQVQTYNGSEDVHVDMKEVTTAGLKYRLEEPPIYDRKHLYEYIGFLAFEEFEQSNYGKISVSTSWTTVEFAQDFVNPPYIIAQVNSENEADMVNVVIKNVNTHSFDIKLAEYPQNDGVHGNEQVTYLALGELYQEPEQIDIAVIRTSSSGVNNIISILTNAGYNVVEMDSSAIASQLTDEYEVLIGPGSDDLVWDIINDASLKTTIQNFVSTGGAYIGICGGAIIGAERLYYSYNGMNIPLTMVGLLDADAVENSDWTNYYIGNSITANFIVDTESSIFDGLHSGDAVLMTYAAGPTFSTSTEDVLLRFNQNLYSGLRDYQVSGRPAVITGTYGQGKVVLSSPHPEYSYPQYLLSYVDWVTSE
jgi:glutamine amidotransferase-like uncharacterized protein